MRPLKLTIEGLTSFKEEQVIDFSTYGLFVITGKTGSGKTSILDAMALALYGDTPRTDGARGDLRHLVSLGSRWARVELEFCVGTDQYRVSRRIPQADRRSEDTAGARGQRPGAARVAVEKLVDGKPVAQVPEATITQTNAWLAEKVGLDFKAFQKAVLLPQGEFDEFLRGDRAERRRILVNLLDLGRYEAAGRRARSRQGALRAECEGIHRRLAEDYAAATPEALGAAEERAEGAAKRALSLATALTEVRALAEEAAAKTRDADRAAGIAEELHTAAERLAVARNTWESLRPEAQVVAEQAAVAETALLEARKTDEAARAALAEAHQRWGTRADLAKWKSAAEQAAAAALDSAGSERALAQLADTLAELEPQCERAKATAESAAREETEARALQTQARTRLETERPVADGVAARVRAEKAVAEAEGEAARTDAQAGAAAAEAAAAVSAAREAEESAHSLRHRLYAVQLRADLTPGDPCPVCEQPVAKIPAGAAAAGDAIEGAEARARTARAAAESAAAASTAAEQARVAQQATLQARREALQAMPTGPTLDEARQTWARVKESCALADQAVEQAKAARERAQQDQSALDQRRAAGVERQKGLVERLSGSEERRSAAYATLQSAFPKGLPEDPAGDLTRRDEAVAAAESAATAATAAVASSSGQVEAIGVDLRRLEQAAAGVRQAVADVAALVRSRSADAGILFGAAGLPTEPTPIDDLDARLAGVAEWAAALGKRVAAETQGLRSRAEKSLAAMAGRLELVGIAAPPGAAASALTALLEEADREAVLEDDRAARLVQETRDAIERAAALLAEKADKEHAAGRYGFLAEHLQGNRFVDFLVTEGLEHLALQASHELYTISGQRYGLTAQNGDFQVVDHANADERRSVSTLSGGETFLASLALALALSTGLASLAGHSAAARLDAVFIDEGFGSLDPETLEVVVDALERLQEGGRTIGVITHVELLAERIPAGLHVERTPSGSRVTARG